MANERMYPLLPCGELDEAIAFYEALGFKRTYRQLRPNPYATVALEDIQIHLFGMDGFDPAQSYGSVIIVVPDPDSLYRDFAARLRIYRLGDSEEDDSAEKTEGLAQIINVAARLGDARGNEALALKTLESGLTRFADAPAIDLARAHLYRAELAVRVNDRELAHSSLKAARSLELTEEERATVADELDHVMELIDQG